MTILSIGLSFSWLSVVLRSLASSHLPMLSVWVRNNYKTQTDLPLGFERQQMLGISLNTLEGIICHLGPQRSPFVQRFAETWHEQYLKMFNHHLASFKNQSNSKLSLFEGVDLLVGWEKQLKSNCLDITNFHLKFHNRISNWLDFRVQSFKGNSTSFTP